MQSFKTQSQTNKKKLNFSDDSDTSSVSSVRDRIQHFETLKQTTSIPIKRSATGAIEEEHVEPQLERVIHGAGQFAPEILPVEEQKQAETEETLAYQRGEELEAEVEPQVTTVVKGLFLSVESLIGV